MFCVVILKLPAIFINSSRDLIGLESSVEKKQCGSGSVMGANAEVVIKHIEEDGVFWVTYLNI